MSTSAGQTLLRVTVGIALPLAMIILTFLPLALFSDRLPNPLSTHWGMQGGPNDSMSFRTLIIFSLVFVGVPAGAMLFCGLKMSALRAGLMRIFPIWAFTGSAVAVSSWQIVRANLDVPDWQEVRQVGASGLGIIIGVALTVGLMTWALMRLIEPAPEPQLPVPSAHLKPGERGMWMGSAKALWAQIMVYGCGIVGVILVLRGLPLGFFVFLLIIPGLTLQKINVIVDSNAVKINYGPFMPKKQVPLGDILLAKKIYVIPLEHGGYAYRGSLRFFGKAAYVLRGGEGIELQLKNDKTLVVTVDDAETGAGLINDLIVRAESESSNSNNFALGR